MLVRNSSISAFSSLKLQWLLMILEDNIVSYIVMNAEMSKMHPLCHNWEGVILNLQVISVPTILVLIANTLHLLHAGYSIRCTIKWIPSKTKVRSIAFSPLLQIEKWHRKLNWQNLICKHKLLWDQRCNDRKIIKLMFCSQHSVNLFPLFNFLYPDFSIKIKHVGEPMLIITDCA